MIKKKIKIAFFGTPDRAVTVLDALKSVDLSPSLVITQPDRPVGRNMVVTSPPVKIWAEKEKIPFIQPENLDESFVKTLRGENFDLFVVVAYGKILKQNVLDIPKHGSLNLHASLLPRLRGASPIEGAILNDEKKNGVTVMLMDAFMDHGPIISQEEVKLDKWPITANELSGLLLPAGANLMAKTIPLWIEKKLKPIEQDHGKATVTKKIKKEDGLLNLNDNPYKNYLKFLAFKDWPTVYFFIERNGKKTRVIVTRAEYDRNSFEIKKVIPEGKKEISYSEFEKNYKSS